MKNKPITVKLTLRKGDTNTYSIYYRANGKRFRKSLRHGDPNLAEVQRQALQDQLNHDLVAETSIRNKHIRISQLCRLYLRAKTHLEAATVGFTSRAFDKLITAIGGDLLIGNFAAVHAEKYQSWLLNNGCNMTSANSYVKSVRPAFRSVRWTT